MAHVDSPFPPTPDHPFPAVERLPDPRPEGATSTDTRWWPPRWLEPRWLARHVDEFDVLHIHFGFDTCSPDHLQTVLDIAHSAGRPVVFTVHDLHNPHFVDDTTHRAQLDVLIPGVDELITLTAGAAQEIERRWGRRATVIPHPHVLPLDVVGRPRPVRDEFVIGLHAKSFRANSDPAALVGTLVDVAGTLDRTTVRIDLDTGGPDWSRRPAAAALLGWRDHPAVDLRTHPRFTDDELVDYLTDIDVSVLPYRFGTHSGWLEACHDVGTAVVVGDCGHHADQRPVHQFSFGRDRFDPAGLARAVRDAHAARGQAPGTNAAAREGERVMIAAMHDSIYRRAVARRHELVGAR